MVFLVFPLELNSADYASGVSSGVCPEGVAAYYVTFVYTHLFSFKRQ